MFKPVRLPPRLSKIPSLHLQIPITMDTPPRQQINREMERQNNMKHVPFCQYGHIEAKYWKNLELLDDAMKKHNISTSRGHNLSAQSLGRSKNHWLLDYNTSNHMDLCQYLLPSTSHSNISKISINNSTQLEVLG